MNRIARWKDHRIGVDERSDLNVHWRGVILVVNDLNNLSTDEKSVEAALKAAKISFSYKSAPKLLTLINKRGKYSPVLVIAPRDG